MHDGNITIENITFNNCRNITNGTISGHGVTGIETLDCAFNFNVDSAGDGFDMRFTGNSGGIVVEDCDSNDGGTFFYTTGLTGRNSINRGQITRNKNYVFNSLNQTEILGVTIFDCVKSAFYGNFTNSTLIDNYVGFTSEVLTQAVCDFNGSLLTSLISNRIYAASGGDVAMDLDECAGFYIAGNYMDGKKDNNPVIYIHDSGYTTFLGNEIFQSDGNSGMDGLRFTTSDLNIVIGNIIFGSSAGTAYGVNITNIDCDLGVLVGNFLQANTSDYNDGSGGDWIIANNL